MGKSRKSVIGTAALVLAGLAMAGAANAAPSGPGTAAQTVSALQASGFHVILSRIGAESLDRCVATRVRPGSTFAREDSGAPGAGSSIVTTVVSKTVYVDVTC